MKENEEENKPRREDGDRLKKVGPQLELRNSYRALLRSLSLGPLALQILMAIFHERGVIAFTPYGQMLPTWQ